MDNLKPISNPNEIPEGFSRVDPNAAGAASGGGGGGGGAGGGSNNREEQMQMILEQALTSDALARLRRIKLVKDVTTVEKTIVSMVMTGKLLEPITEGKLIEMLERSNMAKASSSAASFSTTNKKGSISIQRKKCAFDSDDDDNNDDDLM